MMIRNLMEMIDTLYLVQPYIYIGSNLIS